MQDYIYIRTLELLGFLNLIHALVINGVWITLRDQFNHHMCVMQHDHHVNLLSFDLNIGIRNQQEFVQLLCHATILC